MQPFENDIVEAIVQYMNENQAEGNLSIVQVHGAVADAESARLVDVGGVFARFEASTPTGSRIIDIPWARARTISRRDQIRDELVELYMTAI